MRLIVTEKNNSAKKIAEILSGGEATADATYKVPYYTWSGAEGEQDRKSTRLNSSHIQKSRMPSSA